MRGCESGRWCGSEGGEGVAVIGCVDECVGVGACVVGTGRAHCRV